jgi:hypothetical protein
LDAGGNLVAGSKAIEGVGFTGFYAWQEGESAKRECDDE